MGACQGHKLKDNEIKYIFLFDILSMSTCDGNFHLFYKYKNLIFILSKQIKKFVGWSI